MSRHRAPDQPAQRALVAVIVTLACLGIVAPLVLWPTIEIATSPKTRVRLGDAPLSVAVADTRLRRAFGLQGRRDLPDGDGMLFVFQDSRRRTFRRMAVPFPLEVAFVADDGRVVAIRPLDPAHESARSPVPVSRALELPRGWCARHRVSVGSTLTVEP